MITDRYKTYFTTIRLGKRAAKNNAIGRNAANEFKKSFPSSPPPLKNNITFMSSNVSDCFSDYKIYQH